MTVLTVQTCEKFNGIRGLYFLLDYSRWTNLNPVCWQV